MPYWESGSASCVLDSCVVLECGDSGRRVLLQSGRQGCVFHPCAWCARVGCSASGGCVMTTQAVHTEACTGLALAPFWAGCCIIMIKC